MKGREIEGGNGIAELENYIGEKPDLMRRRIDGLFGFSEGTGANVVDFIKLINKGYAPIMYANHQSYVDAKIFRDIAKKVAQHVPSEDLKGFYLPIAASLETGDQGTFAKSMHDLFKSFDNYGNVVTVPVVREVDKAEHGIQEEVYRKELVKVLNAPKDGFGLAIFPEGGRNGGRIGKDGKINGLQKVEESGLLLHFMKKHKARGVVLLPVGISGTNLIVPPDNDGIPEEILDIVTGKTEASVVANATIGEPFVVNADNVGNYPMDGLMKKVANLLPTESRGVYAT